MTVSSPLCMDKHLHKLFGTAWFDFKYVIFWVNVSFLLKITPRNLYSSTTGIARFLIFIRGSLCIFFREQKCTHWLWISRILNRCQLPIYIYLFRFSCSCHSVHMSGPIAYDKVVDVESTIDWRILSFYNVVYFNEESIREDTYLVDHPPLGFVNLKVWIPRLLWIYYEQIVIVQCKVTLTAIAYSSVVRLILLWDVIPNQDWDTTRSSMTGTINIIVSLVISYCYVIINFREYFLKADNGRLRVCHQSE